MRTSHGTTRFNIPLLAMLLTMLAASLAVAPVRACDTPVFIYGMENWTADRYLVYIFYRGEIAADQQKIVNYLQDNAAPEGLGANIKVMPVDVDKEMAKDVRQRYDTLNAKSLPWVAVYFPKRGIAVESGEFCGVLESEQRLYWNGPLSHDTMESLLNSPVRRKIVNQLLTKRSIPWVMLESGNANKDDAAFKRLTAELTKLHDTLKPSQTLYSEDGKEGDRVDFSIIRVSRTDPKERMLVQMLLHSEPDIAQRTDPMVFPLYARGIILYALVGAGINSSNLHDALAFIIGPCSCEVKDRNPGVEMLIATDWTARLESMPSESTPPPASMTTFSANAEKAQELSDQSAKPTPPVNKAQATTTPTKSTSPTHSSKKQPPTVRPTKGAKPPTPPVKSADPSASATATATVQDPADDTPAPTPPETTEPSAPDPSDETTPDMPPNSGSNPLTRNLLFLLVGAVAVVTGLTLAMKLRIKTKVK